MNNSNIGINDNSYDNTKILSSTNGVSKPNYSLSLFLSSFKLSVETIRCLLSNDDILSEIDFEDLCKTQKLSLSFINDFYDYLPKDTLFLFQTVNEEFIESHMNEFLNANNNKNILKAIARNQNISFDFIDKYKQYFKWEDLFLNPNLHFTIDILNNNKQYFTDSDYKHLIYIQNLNKLINKFILDLDISYLDKLNWNYISWNYKLNENAIEKSLNYLDFNSRLLSKRVFKNKTITCYRLIQYGF